MSWPNWSSIKRGLGLAQRCPRQKCSGIVSIYVYSNGVSQAMCAHCCTTQRVKASGTLVEMRSTFPKAKVYEVGG